jgi:hypothetical protein
VPKTKTGGMFPLPRVGDALLAHWPNYIRLRRACQSNPRNVPVEPQAGFSEANVLCCERMTAIPKLRETPVREALCNVQSSRNHNCVSKV